MKHTATQVEVNSMNAADYAAYSADCTANRVIPFAQQAASAPVAIAPTTETVRNATPSFAGVKPSRKASFVDDLTCNPQIVQVLDGYTKETQGVTRHWLMCVFNTGTTTVKKRINVAELIAECQVIAPAMLTQLFNYDAASDVYSWHGGVKLSYDKGQVAFHTA